MIRPRHFQLAARYLRHRLHELHPYEVQAQMVNVCGRRCVYCKSPEIRTQTLSTEQWKAIIRRLAELGTMRIKFQGGEAALRSDFRELTAEARRCRMIAAVVSHGALFAADPSLLDNIDEVVISLDSPKRETNDALRGPGAYGAAVAAIEISAQRGLRTIVTMQLCRPNLGDMEAMLQFCEARGIPMHAQPVVFGRTYYDDAARTIGLSPEQIRTASRQLAAWKREGRGVLFMAEAYEKATTWTDLGELTRRSAETSTCMAGRDYVHIEPNGDVMPCVQHGADFTPKNIISDGLDESFRHALRHNCGDCWAAYLHERKALYSLRPSALREAIRRG